MTFNTYVFISTVLGFAVGYFITESKYDTSTGAAKHC